MRRLLAALTSAPYTAWKEEFDIFRRLKKDLELIRLRREVRLQEQALKEAIANAPNNEERQRLLERQRRSQETKKLLRRKLKEGKDDPAGVYRFMLELTEKDIAEATNEAQRKELLAIRKDILEKLEGLKQTT